MQLLIYIHSIFRVDYCIVINQNFKYLFYIVEFWYQIKGNVLLCRSAGNVLGYYLVLKCLVNKASFFPTLFFPFQLPRSGKSSTSGDVTPSLNSSNNDEKSDCKYFTALQKETLLENIFNHSVCSQRKIWNVFLMSKTFLLGDCSIQFLINYITTLVCQNYYFLHLFYYFVKVVEFLLALLLNFIFLPSQSWHWIIKLAVNIIIL